MLAFTLGDAVEAASAVRRASVPGRGELATAQRIVELLAQRLRDESGTPAAGLVRLFRTRRLGTLPEPLRVLAVEQLNQGGHLVTDAVLCLVLEGSTGLEPQWCDITQSRGHRVIALPSAEAVRRAPMIHALLEQLGVDPWQPVAGAIPLQGADGSGVFDVFHVLHAAGSPLVPGQEFVARYGIASVMGFGGMLPGGSLFAVVAFTLAEVDRSVALLTEPVAVAAKLALTDAAGGAGAAGGLSGLLSRVGAAEQLLGVYESTVISQTGELERSRDRLAELLDGMSVGYLTLDRDWTVTYLNAAGEAALGRSSEQLLGRNLWEEFPGARELEFGHVYERVLATGETEEVEAYYPGLQAWLQVRAVASGDGLGVYFFDVTARRAAAQAADRAAERLALLGEVSVELSTSPNVESALRRLAALVTPRLADWCVVTVLAERDQLRDVACSHKDPLLLEATSRYARARVDALSEGSYLRRAAATGVPQYLPDAATERLADVLGDAEALAALQELRPRSAAFLPMLAAGRVVGVLSLFTDAERPPLSDRDRDAALDVAARAGLALEAAQSHTRTRRVAEALQRSLLTPLPQLTGLQLAARYQPAVADVQVGGDWYDAFTLANGSITLVIGDVMGHDTEAAAAMSQLRTLVRGIATDRCDGPADTLSRTDRAARSLGFNTYATALVAQINALPALDGHRELLWSSAGHPPAVLLHRDGRVELLTGDNGLLLGVDADSPRHDTRAQLHPGATLLLFTDGLVEHRDLDIDAGLQRLRQALTPLARAPLDVLCDQVIAGMLPDGGDDDVAVIAARSTAVKA